MGGGTEKEGFFEGVYVAVVGHGRKTAILVETFHVTIVRQSILIICKL